jgi:hypothetical protein
MSMRPAAGTGGKRLAGRIIGRIKTNPSVEILTGTSHIPHILYRVVFAEFRRATTLS